MRRKKTELKFVYRPELWTAEKGEVAGSNPVRLVASPAVTGNPAPKATERKPVAQLLERPRPSVPSESPKQAAEAELAKLAKIRATKAARMRRYRANLKARHENP
jgi:hypothetical protein